MCCAYFRFAVKHVVKLLEQKHPVKTPTSAELNRALKNHEKPPTTARMMRVLRTLSSCLRTVPMGKSCRD